MDETGGEVFDVARGAGGGVDDSKVVSFVLGVGGDEIDVGTDDNDNEASPWIDSLW